MLTEGCSDTETIQSKGFRHAAKGLEPQCRELVILAKLQFVPLPMGQSEPAKGGF